MEKKILIIDDNEQDRKGIAIALRKEGYNCLEFAENAEKGIEMARLTKPDIILIDVVLQNVDGFDVCKQLRTKENINAKIIMITGRLDAIEAAKARTSGANEIIEKTTGFNNIGKTIEGISEV